LIGHLVIGPDVVKHNGTAKDDPLFRLSPDIDHLGLAEDGLQFVDLTVQEGLAFLGGMILRILADVPVAAGFFNGTDVFRPFYLLKASQ
jgi:hypothetical protein